MAALSDVQIGATLYKAGFRANGLRTGIAVVLAESGGVTTARNTEGNTPRGSVDRGLWQINSFWHPEVSDAAAYDPLRASKAAYRISGMGRNFGAWSAYGNGTPSAPFAKFKPRAAKAVEQLIKQGYKIPLSGASAAGPESFDLSDASDLLKEPWGAFVDIARFFGALLNPDTWLRIVQTGGGGLLMLMGLFMLFREQVPTPLKRLTRRK